MWEFLHGDRWIKPDISLPAAARFRDEEFPACRPAIQAIIIPATTAGWRAACDSFAA